MKLLGRGLLKRYGKKVVVKGINIEVSQGEVIGLLGPNGAGKTTTFYMLVGIIAPDGGKVFLGDQEVTDWPLYKRARSGISFLPQETSIFSKLSVKDNLLIILEYTGLSRKEQLKRADDLLEELGIKELSTQKAMFLSGGEKRRLEIARALIHHPKFMLLDEPFAGIDPLAVDDIQNIVKRLKSKGIGVLISDHNVRDTMNICDKIYLVYDGEILLEGSPEEITNNPKARRLYLGEDFSL